MKKITLALSLAMMGFVSTAVMAADGIKLGDLPSKAQTANANQLKVSSPAMHVYHNAPHHVYQNDPLEGRRV